MSLSKILHSNLQVERIRTSNFYCNLEKLQKESKEELCKVEAEVNTVVLSCHTTGIAVM